MEKFHIHKCHFPLCLGGISQVNDNCRRRTSSEIAIREWMVGIRGQVMGTSFSQCSDSTLLSNRNSLHLQDNGCRILQANPEQKLINICSVKKIQSFPHLWGQKTQNNGVWGQNSEGERQSLLCSAQNSVSKMSSAPRHKKQKKISMKGNELWNVL